MVTSTDLRAIAGTKSAVKLMDDIAAAINKHAARYGVNSQKRLQQFLANICHETAGFTTLSENLNYSVEGLLKTFGRHRISEADARKYGRSGSRKADQRAIANLIYGGEWGRMNLGNTRPTDGWDMRGSGPGQVTGRASFAKVEKETGLPVLSNPDLLRDPENGTLAALILWQKWGLNELADQGATDAIRKRWNGGTLGLAEVRAAVARASKLRLTVPAAAPDQPAGPPAPAENTPSPAAVSSEPAATAPQADVPVAGKDQKPVRLGWVATILDLLKPLLLTLLKGGKKP